MATPSADHRAPEGAQCGVHPDRPAHFTCPRCGSYACLACWHPEVERCTQCLQRDPGRSRAADLWEQRDKPLARRYFGTFASALSPFKTAPAFAHGEVARCAALHAALGAAARVALRRDPAHAHADVRRQLRGTRDRPPERRADRLRRAARDAGRVRAQRRAARVRCCCRSRAWCARTRRRGAARRSARCTIAIWLLPAAMLFFQIAMGVLPPPPDPTALDPSALAPATATGLALASGRAIAVRGAADPDDERHRTAWRAGSDRCCRAWS